MLRLLLALHPGLSAEVELGEWLSPRLRDWVAALARLPAGSTANNVLMMLRHEAPDEQLALERELASDAAALADLSAAGIAVRDVATKQTSLEDVFLDLVEEKA